MRLRLLISLLLACVCLTPVAHADVAVLLEEPYSYDGALAGTGHTAIYLNRVCAASPTVLRRCQFGESGVVLSRYHRIAGYDWLAIPLAVWLLVWCIRYARQPIPRAAAVPVGILLPVGVGHPILPLSRQQWRLPARDGAGSCHPCT